MWSGLLGDGVEVKMMVIWWRLVPSQTCGITPLQWDSPSVRMDEGGRGGTVWRDGELCFMSEVETDWMNVLQSARLLGSNSPLVSPLRFYHKHFQFFHPPTLSFCLYVSHALFFYVSCSIGVLLIFKIINLCR